MNGKWTKHHSEPAHMCNKPVWEEGVFEGDQWTCDCGRVWAIVALIRPDQREPDIEPHFWWKQVAL